MLLQHDFEVMGFFAHTSMFVDLDTLDPADLARLKALHGKLEASAEDRAWFEALVREKGWKLAVDYGAPAVFPPPGCTDTCCIVDVVQTFYNKGPSRHFVRDVNVDDDVA